MLTNGRRDLQDIDRYRTHDDAMQIVSGNLFEPKVHYEAPPSSIVKKEMSDFIDWFNDSVATGKNPLPALTRAGIAYHYFVSIHPFEDGNGRIARALSIKALSQSINQPILTSLSTIIQNNKKKYYDSLEENSKTNEITKWLIYFAETFLESQNHTQKLIEFLINKAKIYQSLQGQVNERQEKILALMFREGFSGFKGGLSAQNYIAITKTSQSTATRDLQDLVDKNAFIKTVEFKSTRYFLNINSS